MKLDCLIIDDEPLAHQLIRKYAMKLDYLDITASAYLTQDAIHMLKRKKIDIIFLDIRMPKVNGIEMLRNCKPSQEVIITSAFDNYAIDGFELNVCDYLLKPFRFERFAEATQKAFNNLRHKTPNTSHNSNNIFVKSERRYIQLATKDIFYLESFGNYVKIWNKSEFILTKRTLASFENELKELSFQRIHKSFIANTNMIENLDGNLLNMKNKAKIPVSKNYKKSLIAFLQKKHTLPSNNPVKTV